MWSTLQLVRDAEKQAVWVVPNSEHRPSRTFDDPDHGRYVPRWGSAALLKLAVQAQTVGLTPTGVTLRDPARMPLGPELEEFVTEGLVAALRDRDLLRAQDFLQGDRGPYTVMSVQLMADDGARFIVSQLGGFEVSDDEPVGALVSAAESILSIS